MIRDYVEHHISCDGCGINGTLEPRENWDARFKEKLYSRRSDVSLSDNNVLGPARDIFETRRELVARAGRYGWKRVKGKDYCPNCLQKLEEDKR